MSAPQLLLDFVYRNETELADKVWLTQPLGGGPVTDYTWSESVNQARRMATHLQSMGFERGSKIALVSKNCAHFMIAELAIWMAGYTTVAIYPTANEETVGYVLDHSDSKCLFVGKLDTWTEVKAGVPADMPMIAFPLAPKTDLPQWDDIMANTEPIEGKPARERDEVGLIIYTSGSTGQPKGVMHGFGAMSDAVRGMVEELKLNHDDRGLSYLPLAHVFERAYVECTSMVAAHHIFFAESLDTFVQDLQRCRPTVFISVPRLWLKFQLGVFKNMPEKKLNLFLKIPILSGIVKKKILTKLGLDTARLAGSGSAPIPADLIAWYRKLGLNIVEGYAMSEDFAYSHLSTEEFNEPGYVGVPYKGVKVKISDSGEILIDSAGKMLGYYKEEAMTKDSFTEDGFFKTGDRGERKSNGLLKITGRVKEIFKTSKGKYISPAPIENLINNDSHVELSCVSGLGMPQPYAQIVVAEDLRENLGDAAVRSKVDAALHSLLETVNAELEHHERLQFMVVVADEWTIANACLTPTMKIRRSAIEELAQPSMEGWYETGSKVLWA
jgi:long-subunit acyl-CoA synthetase (AMP-forming)